MKHQTFATKQRCKEKSLCQLPRSDYWSSSHLFTHLTLFKVYCRHRFNNLYNMRWGNKKLSLCQLPRSDYWRSSHLFTNLTLFKVDCRHHFNNLYNRRWGNKKLSFRQLPRSGWSFGRAGLGARATYPA